MSKWRALLVAFAMMMIVAGCATPAPPAGGGGGGGDNLLDNVPDPSAASKQSENDCNGGTHIFYTADGAADALVDSYKGQLEAAGWTIESSGGVALGARLTATNGSRYLKFNAGGRPTGNLFVDVCVWPSQPSDTECDQDCDD